MASAEPVVLRNAGGDQFPGARGQRCPEARRRVSELQMKQVWEKAPSWQQLEEIEFPEARDLGCPVGRKAVLGGVPGRSGEDQSFSSW